MNSYAKQKWGGFRAGPLGICILYMLLSLCGLLSKNGCYPYKRMLNIFFLFYLMTVLHYRAYLMCFCLIIWKGRTWFYKYLLNKLHFCHNYLSKRSINPEKQFLEASQTVWNIYLLWGYQLHFFFLRFWKLAAEITR